MNIMKPDIKSTAHVSPSNCNDNSDLQLDILLTEIILKWGIDE